MRTCFARFDVSVSDFLLDARVRAVDNVPGALDVVAVHARVTHDRSTRRRHQDHQRQPQHSGRHHLMTPAAFRTLS